MSVGEYLARIAPYGFSGSCLVARGDEVELADGYGLAVRASGTPNTADTVLSLGSLTKQFTAAAILQLEEQGRLSTGDGSHASSTCRPTGARSPCTSCSRTRPASSGTRDPTTTRASGRRRSTGCSERRSASPRDGARRTRTRATACWRQIELVSGESYERFLRRELFSRAGLGGDGLPPAAVGTAHRR